MVNIKKINIDLLIILFVRYGIQLLNARNSPSRKYLVLILKNLTFSFAHISHNFTKLRHFYIISRIAKIKICR